MNWQRRVLREERKKELLKSRVQQNTRIEIERSSPENDASEDNLEALKRWVNENVVEEQEQIVLSLSFEYGLKPAAIAAEHPQLFSEAKQVRRIKERIIKRARRALI